MEALWDGDGVPPTQVWTDTQTENITFSHPWDAGGKKESQGTTIGVAQSGGKLLGFGPVTVPIYGNKPQDCESFRNQDDIDLFQSMKEK